MLQRVLLMGVALVIVAAAVLVNLFILDLVSMENMKQAIIKTVAIIAVTSAAMALIVVLVRSVGKR